VHSEIAQKAKLADKVTVMQPGDWFTPGRFALVLGLFILAAFPQVLLGLQTFVVRDYGFFVYPLAHFQREAFWRGELPLWNPYNNCGVPFLAQWNTMPLYPPSLIYLILPLNWSLSFFSLLHLFWGGLGMYYLTHRWTGSRLAAAVAGIMFSFNGLSLNLLMWPSHIATFSWMPWVVLCVERAWQEGGRKILIASICGTFQMLAGGPETILLTWLVLSAIWFKQLADAFSTKRQNVGEQMEPLVPRAIAWRFPLMVALVAGLAAAQLLPFLDLAAHSQREQGFADTRWSMPSRGWANFLVPMAFGQVWSMGVFFQHDQAWTSSYYLGVGGLLLAIFAVWKIRHWRVWLFGMIALLALALSMGDHSFFYRSVRRFFPQLSLMTYPVKFVIVISFAAPVLAAFGIERLLKDDSPGRRRVKVDILMLSGILLVLTAGILIWASRSPLPNDNISATIQNGISRAILLLLIAATLFLFRKSSLNQERTEPESESNHRGFTERIQPLLPFILLLLLWVDVWTHEPSQNPTVPSSIYEPGLARAKLAMIPQPELFQSRAMLSPEAALKFREFVMSNPKDNFLVKRLGYFADCNLLDNVPKVDGFFSLSTRESGELLSALYGSTNLTFPHLADFMCVSQVSAPGEFFKWTSRPGFLPFVTGGQKPYYFDDKGMLNAIFASDFDSRKIVCLLNDVRPSLNVSNETSVKVISSRFQNERIEVEVEAAAPSFLVFSQTYYHTWRAYVGQTETPLLRANYAFQAVQVPAGRHQVKLVYHDRAFRLGALFSGITILICIGGFFIARGRSVKPA